MVVTISLAKDIWLRLGLYKYLPEFFINICRLRHPMVFIKCLIQFFLRIIIICLVIWQICDFINEKNQAW
jgi:hypothetical protein